MTAVEQTGGYAPGKDHIQTPACGSRDLVGFERGNGEAESLHFIEAT